MLYSTFFLSLLASAASAALTDSSLEKHVGSLALSSSFNPIKDAYWTGYPHHRRTPFAVSPDGKSAYLAYLDASETGVHVQQVDPSTFAAVGTATTVSGGKEAGGLVAHNDGFALLTNEALPSGTANAPAGSTPVPVMYRFTSGQQTWKTFLAGPGINADFGLAATPDINGDLAYSEAAGMYGAYFVITAYTGEAAGHFGDSIQYVNKEGKLQTIEGASSSWGCSHNTGIAFEAADSVPFASICAEDQGAIWLNTKTQSMNGVKISNENVTNGASNEAMGGMSGSYSGLARFIDSSAYIFTWVSRGAKDLTVNDWLGAPFTHAVNRTNNRNVAIAQFSDKNTLVGSEASATIGAADGDSQVNWITTGTADCSNAHVATFDKTNALVTWEEIANPTCDFISMGCKGAYTGSYFQLVNAGVKVGSPIKSTDTYVAGDMVTMSDGRICWPYVDMNWTLDGPVESPASVTKISFACVKIDGTAATTSTSAAPSSATADAISSSVVKPVSSTVQPASSPAQPTTTDSPVSTIPVTTSVPTSAPAPVEDTGSTLPSFELASSGAVPAPTLATSTVESSGQGFPRPTGTGGFGGFETKVRPTPTPLV
ncbi:hypothetical protein K504DRAFT_476525 [Pleomassaria siparia CBS 279.74]|uniref:Uncharacterized protein n=1 Tax=Pleomassaria siparia CBS 279.74 TaxID=1314801 RepID=A0A6G1KCQ2_9PLEO|nr:hypothetical protein K504DRAFT_476525 [Pleomassaria siparia CBS 279.74]